MYNTYKEEPQLHEQGTNSSNDRTVQFREEVLESFLEIESALVFTDLKCITVIGCFWGHSLHFLLL